MYLFFAEKNAPVYHCFTRTWFGMCGGRTTILPYGSLIDNNNLYAPTPNGNVRMRR